MGAIFLTFAGALLAVENKKKVTRVSWGDTNVYMFLHNDRLSIKMHDGKTYDLILTKADLEGNDWLVTKAK